MAIVKSGQIALGKAYAGRQVLVEQLNPSVWLIKLGEFIPDNERWLHTPNVKADLDKAIAWVESHPAAETDLGELERQLPQGDLTTAATATGRWPRPTAGRVWPAGPA